MNLISPLASGVGGAASGSAKLFLRGSTTPATYYRDFEATQAYTAQPVQLDSYGGATLYVGAMVDVQVFDLNGVLIREFVAGVNAPAVEVISPSFTGTDYTTGQVAANKPTSLQTVLDKWVTSSGTTDFKVLIGTVPTGLQAALAGIASLFFDVRSYGAKGDSTTDNASFIQAAVTAAVAAGGGTIFFAPGVYRVTSEVDIPSNVSVLGSGGTASKIAIDSGVADCAMNFFGADTGVRTCSGMWFGAIGQNFVGTALVRVTGNGANVAFSGCIFGNDAFTKTTLVRVDSTGTSSHALFERCGVYLPSDVGGVYQTGSGRVTLRDCDVVTTFNAGMANWCVFLQDGGLVDGCRFDGSSLTASTGTYISYDAAGFPWGGSVFTNNYFRQFSGGAAIYNRNATPYYDCWESGNIFGDAANGSIAPFRYAADGFAPLIQDIGVARGHRTRAQRSFGFATNGNQLIDAKAYGFAVITRNGAGPQVFTATKGALGDLFTLQIINNSGGVVAPTFGAGFILRGGYVANINNLAMRVITFQWLPDQNALGSGGWVQTGVET